MIFRASVFLLILASVTGTAGCAGNSGRPQKLAARELFIERSNGERIAVRAEIARTEEELGRGLMFRTALADGEGMLFVFRQDQILSFWMENTLIPLSIAYIAWNGKILEMHDMRPRDRTAIRSSRSVRYALEVPRGWFDRAGIMPGDVLLLDPLPASGE
ncbi:MAG: DUF192 domain-containing protein [Spirochaetaceae bacterium]|jgi:uncharacterized membrane protein (UPF0127 family)|nr:DUF192 domain-containing protein [Spirochaetaceae bacterium]